MKMKLKTTYLIAAAVFTLLNTSAFSVSSQNLEVTTAVSDTVGAWGPAIKVNLLNQPAVFRLKVKRHFGTTCQFTVEMTNNGTRTISTQLGFLHGAGQLYEATLGYMAVKPGQRMYLDLERREVLKKGVKNDAIACRNCNPVIGFYNLKLK